MLAYRTPGVYFEWPDSSAARDPFSARDIAGFVGFASRGPLLTAGLRRELEPVHERVRGLLPPGYLAYAVEGFFANGGQTCWVVRVADRTPCVSGEVELHTGSLGAKMVQLTATSPGVWAHDIELVPLRTGSRFSFMLRRPTGEQEIWRDLTVEPDDDRDHGRDDHRFVETVLTPEKATAPGSGPVPGTWFDPRHCRRISSFRRMDRRPHRRAGSAGRPVRRWRRRLGQPRAGEHEGRT